MPDEGLETTPGFDGGLQSSSVGISEKAQGGGKVAFAGVIRSDKDRESVGNELHIVERPITLNVNTLDSQARYSLEPSPKFSPEGVLERDLRHGAIVPGRMVAT